jgi:methylated-DNA-[protein]-cysteine S-methyltransferase
MFNNSAPVEYRIEAFCRTLANMESNMSRRGQARAREHYALFDTAIGPCGLAWSVKGLTRLQLPERDRRATEARLQAGSAVGCTEPVPESVTRAIVALQHYFEGRELDLRDVALDLDRVSPFHRRVYEAARSISWGQTASYGMLARQVGAPGAARAIGQALARNPMPIIIPCHRVIASGRKVGGFSAFGGAVTKARLLALEGIRLAAPAPLLEP